VAHTHSLAFATKERGWEVRRDRLFVTADGGHTWAEVPLGGPVRQYALLPDGMAWLSTGVPCPGDADPARVLMYTADGGANWTEYRLGPMPCDWRALWLGSLQFADARHGWLRSGAALYHTEDGGQSWQQSHFALPRRYPPIGGLARLVRVATIHVVDDDGGEIHHFEPQD